MTKSPYVLGLLLVLATSCAAGTVRGGYQLSVEGTALEGDSEQYRLETGRQAGWILRQHLSLSGGGSLPGSWVYDGYYDDRRPVPERLELRIRRADAGLYAGSKRFVANGPGLLAWERLLTGLQGELTTDVAGKLRVQAAIGEPLGVPMRERLPGRGLVGPYLLDGCYVPVVEGSERILVDGQLLQSGVDYKIDYELGAITFREPVLENSTIDIEYEYLAALADRIALAAIHWDHGSLGLDVLAGNKWSPSPEERPSDQRLRGAAVGWYPTPASHLSASWLLSSAGGLSHSEGTMARQIGGAWLGEDVQAGFDYRAIPPGFHPLGGLIGDTDYQLFTAGYQGLFAPWHSKLSILWRQTPMELRLQQQWRVEHVLSYVLEQGLLGWSLGVCGHQRESQSYIGTTMGILAQRRLGQWELQAERRGLLTYEGVRAPGELLSTTELKAQTFDDSRWEAAIQWKQDSRQPGGELPDIATVWRVKAASTSASSRAWWRMQWLQSEMVRADSGSPSATTYARVEGQVPLAISGLSTGVSLERRYRRDYDSFFQDDKAMQVSARYECNGTSGAALAAGWSSVAGDGAIQVNELLRRTSHGVEFRQPLWRNLAYQGAYHSFGEQDLLGELHGAQRVHGLVLTGPQWQTDITLTGGVLEQPRLDSAEDEDDDKDRSLRTVPMGRRLSWGSQFVTPLIQTQMRIERDWETEATVLRSEWAGSLQLSSTHVQASFTRCARRAAAGVTLEQRGRLMARWAVNGRSELSVGAHTDIRRSPNEEGDYRASGLESGWMVFF